MESVAQRYKQIVDYETLIIDYLFCTAHRCFFVCMSLSLSIIWPSNHDLVKSGSWSFNSFDNVKLIQSKRKPLYLKRLLTESEFATRKPQLLNVTMQDVNVATAYTCLITLHSKIQELNLHYSPATVQTLSMKSSFPHVQEYIGEAGIGNKELRDRDCVVIRDDITTSTKGTVLNLDICFALRIYFLY